MLIGVRDMLNPAVSQIGDTMRANTGIAKNSSRRSKPAKDGASYEKTLVAQAAEAAGNRQKSADYYARLVTLAKNADSARPELVRAKAYLAQR